MSGRIVPDIAGNGMPPLMPASGTPQVDETPRVSAPLAVDVEWEDLRQSRASFCLDQELDKRVRWQHRVSTETKDLRMQLYSRPMESWHGLSEFYAVGEVPVPWQVLFAISADVEHRPRWDTATIGVEEIERAETHHEVNISENIISRRCLHWLVQLPALAGKRDYIFEQCTHVQSDAAGVPMRGMQSVGLPVGEGSRLRPLQRGVTRIDDWRSHLLLWPGTDGNVTRFALCYFEDPKLMLPTWVILKMVCSAMPSSMNMLVEASKDYPYVRLQRMLSRFGGIDDAFELDDEEFFSCSDNEDTQSVISDAAAPHESFFAADDFGIAQDHHVRRHGSSRSPQLPWWLPSQALFGSFISSDLVDALSRIRIATDVFLSDFTASAVSLGVRGVGVAATGLGFPSGTPIVDETLHQCSGPMKELGAEEDRGRWLFKRAMPSLDLPQFVAGGFQAMQSFWLASKRNVEPVSLWLSDPDATRMADRIEIDPTVVGSDSGGQHTVRIGTVIGMQPKRDKSAPQSVSQFI